MRAVVVDRFMEPSELRVREIPEPTPGAGQVIVEVHAAACNFYDTLIVRGRYQVKPPFPFVPGGELAGIVVAVAPDVDSLAIGDRVFGSLVAGAYAERVAMPASALRRVPDGAAFDAAATLPIAYGTAHAGLVQRAALRAGETVLVHAAAGGVGRAAVEVARACGARVIATAGGEAKLEVARAAGAECAIDYGSETWDTEVMALTDGRGADVVYDSVGGDVTERSLRCLAWCGRLLVIGFSSGEIPSVRLSRVMLRNVSVVGLHLTAYAERDPAALHATYDAVAKLLAGGQIRPEISARYTLEALPDALAALADRRTTGKLVITPHVRG
jgi:NADPH2:quinone reductase